VTYVQQVSSFYMNPGHSVLPHQMRFRFLVAEIWHQRLERSAERRAHSSWPLELLWVCFSPDRRRRNKNYRLR